jgi:hypothetical protein
LRLGIALDAPVESAAVALTITPENAAKKSR